jgi:hypothetical protein
MFDSKAKRAAALGFGLSFTLVLPPADGAISIEDAGHASTAYRYDVPALVVVEGEPTWVITVPAQIRTITVPVEARTVSVKAQNRTITVKAPTRAEG